MTEEVLKMNKYGKLIEDVKKHYNQNKDKINENRRKKDK